MPFEKNVFINCPFDADFVILLRPLLFTVIYFDFEPKLSQTKSFTHVRINQIKQYISESKYSIHDLSRSRPLKRNDMPRFNMPYELGLDVGCAEWGGKKYNSKKILVLEKENFHYQKVLSDTAGQDIESHENNPKILIKRIRNWFSSMDELRDYPAANDVWISYGKFYNDLLSDLLVKRYTKHEIEEMPAGDFIKFTKKWIAKSRL